jgi:hypothetical protein
VFTRALHLFLSLARPIQSTSPHPTSLSYILILSTHVSLGLPSGLFPSGFHINNPQAFLFSQFVLPPYQLHPPCFIILFALGEEYKSRSPSLCSFLHSPVTSSLFRPNFLHSTLSSAYVPALMSGSNWFFMTPSIATKFQYINSLLFSFFI